MEVPVILLLFALLSGKNAVFGDGAVAQNSSYASDSAIFEKDDLVLRVMATIMEYLQPIVIQTVENKLKELVVLKIEAKLDKVIKEEEETGKYVQNLFDNMSKKLLEIELQQLRDSKKLEKITFSLSDTVDLILSDMKGNADRLQQETSKTLKDFFKVTKEQLRDMEEKSSQEMEAAKKNIREVNVKLIKMEDEAKKTKNDFTGMIHTVQQKIDIEIIPRVTEISKLLSHVNESTTSTKHISNGNQKEISSAVNSVAQGVKQMMTQMANLKKDVTDTENKLQVMETKLSTAIATVGDNVVDAVMKAECKIRKKLSDLTSNHRNDTKNSMQENCEQKPISVFSNCAEIQKSGKNISGVYSLMIASTPRQVYCDLETDGGGWTVFQRRDDVFVHVDFDRHWADYKRGFGDLSREFWLGLDAIHSLISNQSMSLRVDLEDFEGNKTFAIYQNFSIGGEENKYRLSINGYRGDAGDSMKNHNGQAFSTRDRDNDVHSSRHCAQEFHGAWWYYRCLNCNLNGQYLRGKHNKSYGEGIYWYKWRGNNYSLKKSEMKMRPSDF